MIFARSELTVQTDLFRADKSLRRYGANVERALATWEISPEEWADYIAFLARLLKAIQTHPKDVGLLPHSTAVAARLAQCLNPALPSGVHQKALEVYNYIFSTFGGDFISAHLHELLPGLASVLSFASLSVRPGLYDIFEQHVVVLPPDELRPALKSLILGLLPALEEGQGEDFERAFGVLSALEQSFASHHEDAFSSDDSGGYFWQCLFLGVITSPARRQGALNYLLRALPTFPGSVSIVGSGSKPASMSREVECIVSPEPGLLVRCFVCGLSDSQLLVQRGFLDLLVTNLPLNSLVLQERAGNENLDRLVTAVSQVSLRKDMSLNRRLWSWFLGPEPKDIADNSQLSSLNLERNLSNDATTTTQQDYFLKYGRKSLERCLLAMLQTPNQDVATRARAYRVCSSLMDRWEIGGHLVTRIFPPAMRALHAYGLTASASQVADVVKSASTFFDTVEASLIFSTFIDILQDALDRGCSAELNLELVTWVVDTFNVRDEEMVVTHIPTMLVYLASNMVSSVQSPGIQLRIMTLMSRLLDLIPVRILQPSRQGTVDRSDTPDAGDVADEHIRHTVLGFYQQAGAADHKHPPFSVNHIISLTGSRVASVVGSALVVADSQIYVPSVALLQTLLEKASNIDVLRYSDLCEKLQNVTEQRAWTAQDLSFPMISATVSLIASLHPAKPQSCLDSAVLQELVAGLAAQLWNYLSPEHPKYHVEAVRALWHLEELIAPEDALRSSLTKLTRAPAPDVGQAETFRRFTVLWIHSVPPSGQETTSNRRASSMSVLAGMRHSADAKKILEPSLMLALDALDDITEPAFEVIKSWLHNLTTLDQILQLLFARLKRCSLVQKDSTPGISTAQYKRQQADLVRDLEHVLRHFQGILTHGTQWTWQCLSKTSISTRPEDEHHNALSFLAVTCIELLCNEQHDSLAVNRLLLSMLDAMLLGPAAIELQPLDLDASLLDKLMICINGDMHTLQGGFLKLIKTSLKLRLHITAGPTDVHPPPLSTSTKEKRPSPAPSPRPWASTNGAAAKSVVKHHPPQLFDCIRTGFSSPRARYHLDLWLDFLADILPNFADAIFSNLLPLVGTFCQQLDQTHDQLAAISSTKDLTTVVMPEAVISNLLGALEMILDHAYRCLLSETAEDTAPKDVESRSYFFTNVATGVFKSEGPPSRTATANSRLTVILVLHDAIRVALKMWLWASDTNSTAHDQSSASTTAYNAFKVRNKSRHILEQIFAVEPLESLEVIMLHWCDTQTAHEAASTMSLLQIMQVSKPKRVIPAILDALCTRTNPTSIPTSRHSSLTIDLSSGNVATFLSAYLDSTEDDAMDEVWPNCISFLRDVLSNPLPHRQVLSHLLSIILLLAEKLSNTNFGEQRKMRKDLGDIFQRLLTATFTALPSGSIAEYAVDNMQHGDNGYRQAETEQTMALLPVLNRVTAKIDLILDTPEKIAAAINNISQSLIAPIFRSRTFPKNVSVDVLQLVVEISRKGPAMKTWKKEVTDAFNDPRLFACSPELMADGWFPALHQWSLDDKERMPDLLSRLAPPSSAGIMFGVGASAARLEADRKTQLNLRRMCLLFLASPEDTYMPHLRTIEEKLSELFEASPASSPSATIKAELFMLCRVLTLSVSAMHLSPLWPIINDKLQAVLTSLFPNHSTARDYNNLTLLQACKLLDLLITLSPDEFQLHEWLYITDTIDAVYQPLEWSSAALSDQIAEALGSSSMEDSMTATSSLATSAGKRVPLLGADLGVDKGDVKAMAREDFTRAVLRPFLNQLSIHAYEGVYSMDAPDVAALRQDVLNDLLDVSTMVE